MTLLFTDVEGSTRLLHAFGAKGYAAALAEHRRVIRDACATRGGVEVDTQGDAFFFAFPSASDAVAAASAMMEALASGPIQVRVGLHTGTPLLTGEGYIGDDVHFAARVAATGHGGQVVVSAATAELTGKGLVELGEHRLKDIEGAVPLFQLGEDTFPPLKTISNTNLPRPASSFLGRERELTELIERLRNGTRLLTLTGPGGTGKTRLALEAATSLIGEYKAGVFWVGLAALRDPALVTATIGQTVGAKDGLAEHIGEREMLLLLDNLEQVVESAPELSALLRACPNLAVMATSRELLRVQGEVEYPVPPLAAPDAVELFCERAQLEPTGEIAVLCARLDSLPLAVELAAARTKALSPGKILERLSRRLDLLTGGRDADPRQQTLRATIEWSHDLLKPDEQALFARLAVFAGGCTLEAAESVADADLDVIQSLVEKSLVRYADDRYWMLETIREFAAERLGESPELRLRHAELYADLARRTDAELRGDHDAELLDRLALDHDNVRAALAWASGADPPLAMSLAIDMGRFWSVRGHIVESRRWLEGLLARRDRLPAGLVARGLGDLAWAVSFDEAWDLERSLGEEALRIAREVGDDDAAYRALEALAEAHGMDGRPAEATAAYEEALAIARANGNRYREAATIYNLGLHLQTQGDLPRARGLMHEALELARAMGSQEGVGSSYIGIGAVLSQEGDLDGALVMLRRGLGELAPIGYTSRMAYGVVEIANILSQRDEPERAARLLGAAEAVFDAQGLPIDEVTRVVISRLSAALGEASFAELRAAGRALAIEEAAELAHLA